MSQQNVVQPGGTAKIGRDEYDILLNSSPLTIEGIGNLPIRQVNGATVYIRDVATVTDGSIPQTNVVRQDGRRGVLLTVMKSGKASTLDVVDGIRDLLPRLETTLPPELNIKPIGDQSIFVRASIDGVVREAIIAAVLTGLMILLFLGSWRSTVIIAVSIPLSILTSIIVLSFLGETINIMTLGGLALAVGILVDDATVTIENIERYLEEGQSLHDAILDGAAQISVPALVSTLCICIVFLPMFFLSGVSRFLFVPLAEAVVFAMLASYILSRTLVPTMAMYLLKAHDHHARALAQYLRPLPARLRARLRTCPPHLSGRSRPPRRCAAALYPGLPSALSLSLSCWFPSWDRTSSPAPITARSSCISAPRAARASKRRRASAIWSSRRSAGPSPRPSWTTSSTTSASPTAR